MDATRSSPGRQVSMASHSACWNAIGHMLHARQATQFTTGFQSAIPAEMDVADHKVERLRGGDPQCGRPIAGQDVDCRRRLHNQPRPRAPDSGPVQCPSGDHAVHAATPNGSRRDAVMISLIKQDPEKSAREERARSFTCVRTGYACFDRGPDDRRPARCAIRSRPSRRC